MDEKLLRLSDVSEITSLAPSTIQRIVKSGDFPPPLKISKRAVGWKRSEIEDWINSREKVASNHPDEHLNMEASKNV